MTQIILVLLIAAVSLFFSYRAVRTLEEKA
jgi:hypothetical protein